MYVRIIDGKISQIVYNYDPSLGNDFIEVPGNIANDITNYEYIDGNFVYKERIIIPTLEEINIQVIQKIREQYDQNEEYKMLRFGILDSSNAEFVAYNAYVEECRVWGQLEKEKYKLTGV